MGTLVTLKEFSLDELLLDDDKTRKILIFFFKNHEKDINTLILNDRIKGFAQGLLVEAIDASYAMGFVESLFKAASDPSKGVKEIIKEFGKSAFKHWFKHATASDLYSIEIYETVRRQLSYNFGRHFIVLKSGLVYHGKFSAIAAYDNSVLPKQLWG